MAAALFIGDEITASAYRLAGIPAVTAADGDLAKQFEQALELCDLLLTTTACAETLGEERILAGVRRARPLLLVVPDVATRRPPPDIDAAVDRVLGIEA